MPIVTANLREWVKSVVYLFSLIRGFDVRVLTANLREWLRVLSNPFALIRGCDMPRVTANLLAKDGLLRIAGTTRRHHTAARC